MRDTVLFCKSNRAKAMTRAFDVSSANLQGLFIGENCGFAIFSTAILLCAQSVSRFLVMLHVDGVCPVHKVIRIQANRIIAEVAYFTFSILSICNKEGHSNCSKQIRTIFSKMSGELKNSVSSICGTSPRMACVRSARGVDFRTETLDILNGHLRNRLVLFAWNAILAFSHTAPPFQVQVVRASDGSNRPQARQILPPEFQACNPVLEVAHA